MNRRTFVGTLLVGAPAALVARDAIAKPPQVYEYKYRSRPSLPGSEKSFSLNEACLDGWELVTESNEDWVFRRPVSPSS